MNIIFLDVDGVLNSLEHLKEEYYKNKRPYSGYDYPFDPKCLNNLVDLVNQTDAYLVITSTWRMDEIGKNILLEELKKYGLDHRIQGFTKILHTTRGEEVKLYLSNLNNVNYVILDDDNDFLGLEDHLVKTSFNYGLTEEDVKIAVKKLKK